MKNAADLIIDGATNSTLNSATIENTKHALGLADQHIVIALSTLTEVEEIRTFEKIEFFTILK